jgi:hypothetical protein
VATPELIWADKDDHLELWRTPIDICKEQDRNAQVLPPEMMERLSETIKRDKRLESIPFVVKRTKGNGEVYFEIVSGHHRVRATRMAGVNEILVLADTTDMPRSKVVAKQIAHNSITGLADPAVLIEMFDEIDNLEDALEAFVDPAMLKESLLEEELPVEEVDIDEDWRTVMLAFLGNHLESFEGIIARLSGTEDMVGAIDMNQFELFQSSVARVSQRIRVHNIGAVIVAMCNMVNDQLDREHGRG